MRRRNAFALVVAVTVLGGCARSETAGLHVKGYAANLVFSANPRPPVQPPGMSGPTAPVPITIDLPTAVFNDRPFTGPPLAPRPVCAQAKPGAGALEPATPVAPAGRRPEVGAYRWKRSGTQGISATNGGGAAKVDLTGFERRVVRDVREVSGDGTFAYQTVKPDLGGATYVTTWQVKPEALQERVSELDVAFSVGDPERGLSIKAIDSFDASNQMTGSFRPTTGLLVLPLPVVPGEQFTSVAVDPQTFQAAEFQAQVVSRDRVDACGDYVEGWRVSGTLTFSGAPPEQYDILVAPQLGTLVISEHVVTQNVIGPLDVTTTLGQLHPTVS
jgi:hypothetical protein